MPALVLVGAQWGDEGKGKATDQLSGSVDYVVKFNGGNNAGHTVVIGSDTYALHLLPSGILSPGCTPVIGNGVVVDLSVLFEEIDALEAAGVSCAKLVLSGGRAPDRLVQPHAGQGGRALPRQAPDRHHRRGIGPTYADKMNRHRHPGPGPVRRGDPAAEGRGRLDVKNQVLVKVYNRKAVEVDAVVEELLSYVDRVRPDGGRHVAAAQRGAGPRRDGAARGRPGHAARRRPRHLPVRHVVVGDRRRRLHRQRHRPAPGRQGHRGGQGLHDPGRRGARSPPSCWTPTARRCARPATSSAPRPAGRAAAAGTTRSSPATPPRVNGVTDFVLTKLDVLTGWERIPVCVAYEVDGKRFDEMPMSQTDFHHATPVYEYLDGWTEDITGARTFEDLPKTGAGVRHRARADERCAVRVDRRRPGPRADPRAAAAARMIFKGVRDGRPYPDPGMTLRQWARCRRRRCSSTTSSPPSARSDLEVLLAEDSTFYGDMFAHVVEWRGDLYLEDGLHRALRCALAQRKVPATPGSCGCRTDAPAGRCQPPLTSRPPAVCRAGTTRPSRSHPGGDRPEGERPSAMQGAVVALAEQDRLPQAGGAVRAQASTWCGISRCPGPRQQPAPSQWPPVSTCLIRRSWALRVRAL
jgi:adenylosuccinate synthase